MEGITYPEVMGHITDDELRLVEIRARAGESVPESDTTAQAERDRSWLLGLVDRLLKGEHIPSVAFTKLQKVSPELAAKAVEG